MMAPYSDMGGEPWFGCTSQAVPKPSRSCPEGFTSQSMARNSTWTLDPGYTWHPALPTRLSPPNQQSCS